MTRVDQSQLIAKPQLRALSFFSLLSTSRKNLHFPEKHPSADSSRTAHSYELFRIFEYFSGTLE